MARNCGFCRSITILAMKFPALFVLVGIGAGSLLGQTGGAPAVEEKRIDALHGLSEQLEALSNRVGKAVVQIYASGYRLSNPDETRTEAAAITRERDTGSGAILTAGKKGGGSSRAKTDK